MGILPKIKILKVLLAEVKDYNVDSGHKRGDNRGVLCVCLRGM